MRSRWQLLSVAKILSKTSSIALLCLSVVNFSQETPVSKDVIKEQQWLTVLTLYYASVSRKIEQENY